MIFTIGHTQSYQLYFEKSKLNGESCNKLGRTKDYVGGSVWKTFEEATMACSENYSVYGVEADWDRETVRSEDGDWNDLLVSSRLIDLNDQ